MVDPLAGVLISTRYRLIGQLGSGETGIVWDARDEQLDLPVAIKELRPPEPASEQWHAELLELVRAEARYTGQLSHPKIVAVYDVVSDFDRPWIIMPRVTGRSLATEIAASGTWDPARVARLGLQLVEALEAAHAEGVGHGAVKPSNVLIPDFGAPMLTDFSLTPAPHEADLLGLGKVLYFAVEGRSPKSAELEPPQNAGLITEVVEGLLASDPSQRPTLAQTREQLTATLAAFAAQRKQAQLSQGDTVAPASFTSATDPEASSARLPIPAPAPPTGTAPLPGLTALPSTRATAAPPHGSTAGHATTSPLPGSATTPPDQAATSPLPGPATTPAADQVAMPLRTGRATPPPPTSPAVPGHAPAPSVAGPASAPPGFVAAQPTPSVAGNAATAPALLTPGHATARSAPASAVTPTVPGPIAAPVTPTVPGPIAAPVAPAAQASAEASSIPSPVEPAPGHAVVPSTAVSTAATSARRHAAAAPNRSRLIIATAVTAVVVVATVAFAFLRSPGAEEARFQPSASAPAAPDTTTPQQPVNVIVSGRSTDTVTLAWDAGIDNVGVTEYRVQRDGTQIGAAPTPDYTDKGLAVNTTYTYTVTAVDAAGNISVTSAAVTATTLRAPDTTKPSTPGNLRITGRSTTSIVLGWTAATDDVGVARYEVRRDGTAIATVAALHYTDSGLTPATSHSYVVVAIDATGNVSKPTGPVTGVTLTVPDTAAPSTPGSPHVTGTTTTTISLAWTASSDNTGVTNYLVYRNGVLVASPTALTYTDPGLTPGTTYTYQVKAIDGAGNISAAAVISAATVAPKVTDINAAISIGAVPACTVTITATVAVTAGPVTVNLQVNINDVTSTKLVSFPGTGPASQVVGIGTGSGTEDGTVQVSSTSPNPVTSTKTWTSPDACRPGFTVTSPTAQPDSCDSPTISGSLRVTTRNNPGPAEYTVQMLIDGNNVAQTTITLDANISELVSLISPDVYPNGTYAVSYVVTQDGSSATSSTVNTEVNC